VETLKPPLSRQKEDQLSKISDKLHLNSSKESCNQDEGRGLELSSSPRTPAKWQLQTTKATPKIALTRTFKLHLEDEPIRTPPIDVADEPSKGMPHHGDENKDTSRPSAVFRAVGRDAGLQKDAVPEIGHYDPLLTAVTKRSFSASIVDRPASACRRDDRAPLDPQKPRPHVPALPFRSYIPRSAILTGRNLSTMSAGEQRAFYTFKEFGPTGSYDVDRYWNGPGKCRTPSATLTGAGRDAALAAEPDATPRVYSGGPAFHVAWATGGAARGGGRGCAVDMRAMQGRDPARPVWTVRHVVPAASTTDYADFSGGGGGGGGGGAASFDRMLPRERTAAAVRSAPSPSQHLAYAATESDGALRTGPAGLVPFDRLAPRPPPESMQAAGRDSPDVFYDLGRVGGGRGPRGPFFGSMLGRAGADSKPLRRSRRRART
jgi:hypothetical protein